MEQEPIPLEGVVATSKTCYKSSTTDDRYKNHRHQSVAATDKLKNKHQAGTALDVSVDNDAQQPLKIQSACNEPSGCPGPKRFGKRSDPILPDALRRPSPATAQYSTCDNDTRTGVQQRPTRSILPATSTAHQTGNPGAPCSTCAAPGCNKGRRAVFYLQQSTAHRRGPARQPRAPTDGQNLPAQVGGARRRKRPAKVCIYISLCGVAPMAPLHSVVFRSRIAVLNTRDRTMWDMCETVPVSANMSPCVLLEP